jgi:hypothetical protein
MSQLQVVKRPEVRNFLQVACFFHGRFSHALPFFSLRFKVIHGFDSADDCAVKIPPSFLHSNMCNQIPQTHVLSAHGISLFFSRLF